ncbi:MAG TPA: HAD family phosphatase [Candidatus Saccharimonadales bacterium]|nr:HAD family phosphatase [Candidatus Saccharimonadales bacterium]
MIRGIIFDCYGVLVSGSLDYLRSLTPADKRQEFTDLARAADNGFISREEYVEGVSELIGKPAEAIYDIISQQEVKNPEMLAYVKELRKNYRTALLSNVGRGSIERLFSKEELADLFDVVALSSEIGMTKPSLEAYDYVASRLDLTPEECVMVDDIALNAEGAEMAGMSGVVFTNIESCRQDIERLVGAVRA